MPTLHLAILCVRCLTHALVGWMTAFSALAMQTHVRCLTTYINLIATHWGLQSELMLCEIYSLKARWMLLRIYFALASLYVIFALHSAKR